MSQPDVSVIIPNRNGSATVGSCLEAAFASDHESFEVIVVDDCSTDSSVEVIRGFPCRLTELPRHAGAAAARNTGARQARGRILFFTDADCLLNGDTLRIAQEALETAGPHVVVGGTYARKPPENSFFSIFQAVFVNHFETRNHGHPDYVATHAMAIPRKDFIREKGFPAGAAGPAQRAANAQQSSDCGPDRTILTSMIVAWSDNRQPTTKLLKTLSIPSTRLTRRARLDRRPSIGCPS